jgi:hypothetical protein
MQLKSELNMNDIPRSLSDLATLYHVGLCDVEYRKAYAARLLGPTDCLTRHKRASERVRVIRDRPSA